MNHTLFGTDGIRGIAGEYPLDESGCYQIGKAIAHYFAKNDETIIVGYDPRESSPSIAQSVIKGINAMGTHTVLVGVLPTPALAYLTRTKNVVAGVMITASHNPYTDNGIKIFTPDGAKLSDKTEEKLNELIQSELTENERSGNCTDDLTLLQQYEDFVVSSVPKVNTSYKVVLDCANGATSTCAQKIFERCGYQVVTIHNQPSGKNINVGCGATHTESLQKTVKDQHFTAGAAFDGDGDRIILVDEKGRALDGDHLLYILATTSSTKGVVATVMSNMGLDNALSVQAKSVHRTAVGDRYVLQGLEETGYTIGGEQSGHIILHDIATTGDGILAALHVLARVQASGKQLGEWRDDLQLLPQQLLNIPIKHRHTFDHPRLQSYIASENKQLGAHGRLSVRLSGTEPLIRVMVESSDALQRAERIVKHMQSLMTELEA